MIENAALSNDDIKKILYTEFALHAYDISKINFGRSNLYKVYTDSGKFVLKQFQLDVPASAINKEIDICKYLADRCFKTSNFVNSINNTKIIIYRDMNITLQKYIEGKTYKIHAAPRWLFLESACLLGKLHIILSNYTVIQNRFGGDWPNCNDYDKAIKEHTEIREKALSSYNVYTNQIISDMNYKIQVLNELHSNIVINKSKLLTRQYDILHSSILYCRGIKVFHYPFRSSIEQSHMGFCRF